MKLSIPDMSCEHCKATVQGAVTALDPGARVVVNLAAKTAEIEAAASSEAVLKALAAAGYPATQAG